MTTPTTSESLVPADRATVHRRLLVGALCLLVLASFGRVVFNKFTTWDDPHTLIDNPMFNPPNWELILETWDPSKPTAALYVPVTYVIWGVVAHLGYSPPLPGTGPETPRLNPAFFHAASLLVHLGSTLLVFWLVERLLEARRLREKSDASDGSRWSIAACAWVGAAVFGVHPIQVEAVGWTSGLKDLLWVFFVLCAVHCYLNSALPVERPRFWNSRWWWGGILLFVTAMLCKPTAMVLPALLVCLHGLGVGASWRTVVKGTWVWWLFVPWFAWIARSVQPGLGTPTLELPYRPLIALDSMAFYLWKLVWPWNLGFEYGRTPLYIFEHGYIFWTWVVPVGIGVLLIWKRRQWPLVVAGAGWAIIATAPVLGAIPFLYQYYTTVADHYMYGAMAGVALTVGFVLTRQERRGRKGVVVATVVALVIGVLGARSFDQMGVWRTSVDLYRHGLSVNPRAYAAYTNIGAESLLTRPVDREKLENGIRLFDIATSINPNWAQAYDNRAFALIILGRRDEAIANVEKAMELNANLPPEIRGSMSGGQLVFAEFLVKQGKYEAAARMLRLAVTELERGLPRTEKPFQTARGLLTQAEGLAASRPTTRATTQASTRASTGASTGAIRP